MCSGIKCPAKEYCYRYTAPVNIHRQTIFNDPPIKGYGVATSGQTTVYCDCFSPNQKELDKSIKIIRDDNRG
jgi:hypothetical protein